MNSKQLTNELQRARTSEQCIQVVRLCDERRDEVRARQNEIGSARFGSAVRTAATIKGPEASKALEDEIEALARELVWLDDFSQQAHDRADQFKLDEARVAVATSKKQLPAAMRRVRETMQAFDTAVAALNAVVNGLAEYGIIPGAAIPLNDSELAELFQLRDEAWVTRKVSTLVIPVNIDDMAAERERWPKSLPMFYQLDDEHMGLTLRRRKPPCCATQQV